MVLNHFVGFMVTVPYTLLGWGGIHRISYAKFFEKSKLIIKKHITGVEMNTLLGLSGTALLILVGLAGFQNQSLWLIPIFGIVAAYLGVSYPTWKAQMAKERGIYWKVFFQSIPLQIIFMAFLYGAGFGINYLLS